MKEEKKRREKRATEEVLVFYTLPSDCTHLHSTLLGSSHVFTSVPLAPFVPQYSLSISLHAMPVTGPDSYQLAVTLLNERIASSYRLERIWKE